MLDSQMYIDFVEGNLDYDSERDFIGKFSNDDEFRTGFKGYLSITGAINSNIKSFGPSLSETSEIYSKLGYSIPSLMKPTVPEPANQSSIWLNPVLKNLLIGICSSVATLLLVLLLWYQKNSVVSINQPTKILNEAKLVPDIQKNKITAKIKQTPEKTIIKYVHVKNEESKNISLAELLTNEKKNSEDLTISPSNEKFYFSKNFIHKYTSDHFETFQNNFEKPFEIAFTKSIGRELGLSFELKSSVDWNIPKETIYPAHISKFNNLGIDVIYDFSKNFSVGVDLRQETFFLRYNGTELPEKIFDYEQQPNLTSLSLFGMYGLNINSFLPYVRLMGGGNKYGMIGRAETGIKYDFVPGMAFYLGFEYSRMYYLHQNNWFNAGKYGLNYGFSYKF